MKLSPHLDTEHGGDVLACACGCGFGTHPDDWDALLPIIFETIRARWGVPLRVASGCRCRDHNHDIGGEPNSQHLHGCALDIACPTSVEFSEFSALAALDTAEVTGGQGGVGFYPPRPGCVGVWVHVDTGKGLTAGRRWTR